ncbi:MAG: ATP-grasp domain-containing protein, partial [Actinomycetes bacterium]
VETTEEGAIERVLTLSALGRVLIEVALDLEAELAVMVARSADGSSVVYPPVVTTQVDGMCREVVVPAPMDGDLLNDAQLLALDVAEVLEVVGVLAVELFVVDGMLAICEVAARPHNSGHWTIEGTSASQFENHLRAVTGLPLHAITMTAPAVVMVNLVGNEDGDDPAAFLAQEQDPTGIHLYGKLARPGRKLGHVTLLGDEVPEVRDAAWELTQRLHGALPSSDSLS